MLRINGLRMPIGHSMEELTKKVIKELKIPSFEILSFRIVKKSIDARKGDVKYVYSVDVEIKKESSLLKKKHIVNNKNIMLSNEVKYEMPVHGKEEMKVSPVVVGSGPAGLFCAYLLAEQGYRPVLIERGEAVDKREETVKHFWNTGILNRESNVQFGEGGAGTFSDGKLNTLVNDRSGRNRFVLETFHKFGAPERILYDSKPHIGTDILKQVVRNMRRTIVSLGGCVRFETKLTDLYCKEDEKLCEIEVNHGERIPCHVLVLALGHSARDTFQILYEKGIAMEPKSFAVGVRIEHPQEMINRNQYGEKYFDKLPAAPYKLAKTVQTGRNVYSFCMCPGGYVVNASSEEKRLAINGMSYSRRDSGNANSAIIVSVTPADFENAHPMAGVEFQRKLEELAYLTGEGNIPVQLYGDFQKDRRSKSLGEILPCMKGAYVFANLREVFPPVISQSLILGIDSFGKIIENFNRYDGILSGVESRTSSPLRILRNEAFLSNIGGIYPCGEGAGYAGGIMSAAMDGMKVAEAIIRKYSVIDGLE